MGLAGTRYSFGVFLSGNAIIELEIQISQSI